MEQTVCPRILYLRHMHVQPLHWKLLINMYASDSGFKDSWYRDGGLFDRLDWSGTLIRETCSSIGADDVHMRLMLDELDEVERFKKPQFTTRIENSSIGCKFELAVDCTSELDCYENEFAGGNILAVWRPESRWSFDDQEIARCRALCKDSSRWSTGAMSPSASEDFEGDSVFDDFEFPSDEIGPDEQEVHVQDLSTT